MDEKKIVAIANESALTRKVFQVLDDRQREPRRGQMEIRRVAKDIKKHKGFKTILPADLIPIFEKLEGAGVGTVIPIPKKPTVFQFNYLLEDIIAVALKRQLPEGKLRKVEAEKPAPVAKLVKSAPVIQYGASPKADVLAVLPSGKEISLSFVSGLTKDEAEVLCQMIMRRVR